MSSEHDQKIGDSPNQVSDNLGDFGYSGEFETHLLLEAMSDVEGDDDFDNSKITSLLDDDNAFLENFDKHPRNIFTSQRVCATEEDLDPHAIRPGYDENSSRKCSQLQTKIMITSAMLGGIASKPEDIVKLMNVKGLSVGQVKSHLETYHHSKYVDASKSYVMNVCLYIMKLTVLIVWFWRRSNRKQKVTLDMKMQCDEPIQRFEAAGNLYMNHLIKSAVE
ncbi:hypothetical protein M5689_018447 [Euphorbia peplus]|nr:hypothetical protein M5689_018447 [Euphorbia peplus]